jgi:hypothetical protein
VHGRWRRRFDRRMNRRFAHWRLYRGLDRNRFGNAGGFHGWCASAGFFNRFRSVIFVLFLATRWVDVALDVRADEALPQQHRDIFVY